MGVHPVRFVDDVYNFCTQYIKRSVDSLEGTLASDEETKEDPTAVRDGCAGCQARLIGAFDKNIDKFELYVVRNCMRIPVHIDESSASIITAAGAVSAGLDGKCAFLPRNLCPMFRKLYAIAGHGGTCGSVAYARDFKPSSLFAAGTAERWAAPN